MNESGRLAATWERLRTVPGLGRDVTALVVMIAATTFYLTHKLADNSRAVTRRLAK